MYKVLPHPFGLGDFEAALALKAWTKLWVGEFIPVSARRNLGRLIK